MNFDALYEKYYGVEIQDDGAVNSEQMKVFFKDFRSALRFWCKTHDFTFVKATLEHYGLSAFVKDNVSDKFIYISYDVPRGLPIGVNSPFLTDVLYREAENEKDFRGKLNHFSSLKTIGSNLTYFANYLRA